ncbi:hypothetical protein Pfo_010072, partial [Paulownia fortunei]
MSSNTPSLFHNTFNHPTSIKLDRNNFLLCKSQVLPAIRSHQLGSFIFGTQEIPPKFISYTIEGRMETIPNPDFITWEQQDQLLLSWLLGSMSEGILGYVGSMTAEEFLLKMKTLTDQKATAGESIPDKDMRIYILNGIGLEFIPLVTSIITRPTLVSLSELATMRNQKPMNNHNFYHQGSSSRGRGRNFNSREGGRYNGSHGNNHRQCQVYGKLGHMALNYYYRFDSNFQAPINNNSNQISAMVANPRTLRFANLSLHTPYDGSKKIFVGNGTCLSISNVGSSLLNTHAHKIKLHNILHVPSISKNLLSDQVSRKNLLQGHL